MSRSNCLRTTRATIRVVFILALMTHTPFESRAADRLPFGIESASQTESQIVGSLQERLATGESTLEWNERYGYLESVLEALKIPITSQLLVYSKTSQLREHISPKNPRAIYFNDETYVAWVPGTPHIEIASIEPRAGSIFYMLEQDKHRQATIERSVQCLECHTSNRNLGIPGPIVRSFPTDASGSIERNNGVSAVNHTVPMKYRWGGWYVTGTTGLAHRGNQFGSTEKTSSTPKALTHLDTLLDVTKYPTDSSDMVALLVLEHQAHMQTLITRLHQDAETAIASDGNLNRIRNNATDFLKYLLFIDEATLEVPVAGNTDFAKRFQANGPRDSKGRSLRDLNLKTRLLNYPCSYLIHSPSFQKIHPRMKRHLYRRLHNILTEKDTTGDFEKLTHDQRQAILEILTETIDDLPSFWML